MCSRFCLGWIRVRKQSWCGLLQASDWRCDNAFVAARNAAIEITGCGATGGFDVASAANDALERIEKLANTTA